MKPTVTRIIGPWTDFSMIRPDVLAAAADRGSRVHHAIEADLRGLWPYITTDIQGFFDSYKRWADTMVIDIASIEPELIDEVAGYLGHTDLIARLKGDGLDEYTIIDWKTPASASKSWAIQTAAYRKLAEINGYNIIRNGCLRLKKDGSAAIWDEFTKTYEHDWNIFQSCLNAYKYFK